MTGTAPCFLPPAALSLSAFSRRPIPPPSPRPQAASPKRRRRPVCTFDPPSASTDRRELDLITSLVSSGGTRAGLSVSLREQVDLGAQVLEASAGGAAVAFPDDLWKLDGVWTLLYTSEAGGVPGAATGVRQRFAVDERRVENCVCVAVGPPRAPAVGGEVVLGATFDVVDRDTLKLSLVDVQVRVRQPGGGRMRDLTPRLPLPDWRVPAFARRVARGTSQDVRTTYYGQAIRVARSSGGELRIFCRQR